MLDVTLRRASTVPRELRIIPIEAAVILDLRSTEGSNSPYAQPLPINVARESFQGSLRQLADIPVIVVRLLYGLNKA